MTYYSANVHYISEKGELPEDVKEVFKKYGASIVNVPKKEGDKDYYLTVDLGKSTSLDVMQFMKECTKVKGVCGVAGGRYNPSLVQRVRDFFKK